MPSENEDKINQQKNDAKCFNYSKNGKLSQQDITLTFASFLFHHLLNLFEILMQPYACIFNQNPYCK